MHTVTESIYSGENIVVPLADVQHIELHNRAGKPDGIMVVTGHTRWDHEHDVWANGIWISEPEATAFRTAWCRYRSELEFNTLADLRPDAEGGLMQMHEKDVMERLLMAKPRS